MFLMGVLMCILIFILLLLVVRVSELSTRMTTFENFLVDTVTHDELQALVTEKYELQALVDIFKKKT